METISNALFWISNGLLVPVIVLLLLFFARAVLLAGGFFGEFYRRVHTQKSLAEQLEELTPDNIEEKANSLTGDRSTPYNAVYTSFIRIGTMQLIVSDCLLTLK